jgi:hypothetical protein
MAHPDPGGARQTVSVCSDYGTSLLRQPIFLLLIRNHMGRQAHLSNAVRLCGCDLRFRNLRLPSFLQDMTVMDLQRLRCCTGRLSWRFLVALQMLLGPRHPRTGLIRAPQAYSSRLLLPAAASIASVLMKNEQMGFLVPRSFERHLSVDHTKKELRITFGERFEFPLIGCLHEQP